MSTSDDREYRADLRSYLIGLGLAVVLSAIPFAAIAFGRYSQRTAFIIIAACAIVQIPTHFRFFLHIDLSRSKRDDLQLILFSTLIVVLMIGGTIWILGNQKMRMMG